MSHIERITVVVKVGGDYVELSGTASTENSWIDLTEAQIKEKAGQLYRDAIRGVLNARKKVTPS